MAKKSNGMDNLRPFKTSEEARENGRKGGIKSGEVRRRKRAAREAAKLILDLPCPTGFEKNLKHLAVDEGDFTNRVALFARAFSVAMAGDVRAMEFMINSAGERPEHLLEEKRFDLELGKVEGSDTAIDDWINSIPDVIENEDSEEGETNGEEDDSPAEET